MSRLAGDASASAISRAEMTRMSYPDLLCSVLHRLTPVTFTSLFPVFFLRVAALLDIS